MDAKNSFDPDFDPANAKGQDFYRYRVRYIRQELIGPSWVKDSYKGLEGVKSIDGRFRLITWIDKSEDASTREESATVHRRGSAGQQVIKDNGEKFSRQTHLSFETHSVKDEDDLVTTIVMLVSLDNGRLRAKLTIPISDITEGHRSELILGAQYLLMDEAFPGPDSDNGIASPPPSAPAPDFPIDER